MPVIRTVVDVRITVIHEGTSTYDPPVSEVVAEYHAELPSGTGQGQIDRAYIDERTYTASTAVDHDVNTYTDKVGTASQAIGGKTKLIMLRTKNTTAGEQWQLGGDTNAIPVFGAAAHYAKLGPNGLILIVDPIDGIATTAGTGDIMQVTPPAAAVAGQLIVAGTSA